MRGDEQPIEVRRLGAARQVVEQADDVGGERRIAGQETDVGVEASGSHVIVPGADVRVGAEARAFLAHDQRDLRVRLERQVADGDVGAGALELGGPVQVALLVESRLQLDHAGDLLAGFGGADQRAHERRVVADAIDGHLDRHRLRVVSGRFDELLDAVLEALVGMVHEQIAGLDHVEDGIRGMSRRGGVTGVHGASRSAGASRPAIANRLV